MIDLAGFAWRGLTGISVCLFGCLPDSCSKAKITDKYPGGNINYIVDPGRAEVFITETRDSGSICLPYLVPWKGQVDIFTTNPAHDTVRVYVNGKPELDLDVIEVGEDPKAAVKQLDILPWKVIALVGINPNDKGPYHGCEIVPDHMAVPAIYRKVHGPASYQECRAFVEKSCVA